MATRPQGSDRTGRRTHAPRPHEPCEDLEIRLLLEGVCCHYGYDFRDYALSSIRRRVRLLMQEEGLSTVSSVQDRVLHDTSRLAAVPGACP